MVTVSIHSRRDNGDFHRVASSLLLENGLPLGSILPAAEIERIFRRHEGLFGDTYNGVYSTAVVLWAFLSQVLADGKMRSCTTAVARVIDFAILTDRNPPSTDTGAYCTARQKLDEKALYELVVETAAKIELVAPDEWLWHDRHAKLVDGFTAIMPDTPENQEEFPKQKEQKAGIGFPIMRACVILSLATACVIDAAFGPYSGKQTGEMALFRQLLDSFQAGDVAVFDRYYSSYTTLALLMLRDVDACARLHQGRPRDFRRGKRLGKYDRLITWERPKRPEWMDEATYETIPETLTLRMIRFNIVEPGCRTKSITIVTTLVDAEEYSNEDLTDPQLGQIALPDARHGAEGILDHAFGLQSDPANHLRRGHRPRQAPSPDQFHPNMHHHLDGLVKLVPGPLRPRGSATAPQTNRLAGSA